MISREPWDAVEVLRTSCLLKNSAIPRDGSPGGSPAEAGHADPRVGGELDASWSTGSSAARPALVEEAQSTVRTLGAPSGSTVATDIAIGSDPSTHEFAAASAPSIHARIWR